MDDMVPRKSRRRFTKAVVVVNLILVWALMFASIIYQQAEHVIGAGFALIGTLFGVYTGIGHMDYRKAVDLAVEELTHETEGEEG